MAKQRPRLAAWYDALAAFNVESLFSRRRKASPPRTVYVHEQLPADSFDHKGRVLKDRIYPPNQVITSKYTLITFLPRNLLEQFRRIANIFFLGIAVLQFFSEFSTISPGLVILPLLIVLGITAAKDGYEDFKRHQSDRRVNHARVRVMSAEEWVNPNPTADKAKTFARGVGSALGLRRPNKDANASAPGEAEQGITHVDPLIEYDDIPVVSSPTHHHHRRTSSIFRRHEKDDRPHWRSSLWEDVRVGDFVKIMDNEPIPSDILICATSEEENVAFVETKNLDGETNLKSRNAVSSLTHLRSAADCADPTNAFHVNCDIPDNNMYRSNAAVVIKDEKASVDMQNILLRGTVLRNTTWVIAVVLFTGVDTKIVLNSGGTPSKRSKVERQMNPQVFINLILLAVMAIACAIADSILEVRFYPAGPWLYDDNRSDNNPHINGLITFAFALITFQNIIPISLYISIEFVRTCQAAFIYFDKDIWYEKTDQATLARSWNLSDDLGQIEYIFSDKTGTLTQNSMVFRQCTINGKVYSGDSLDDSLDQQVEDDDMIKAPKNMKPVDIKLSTSSSSGSGHEQSPKTAVPDPMDSSDVKLAHGVLHHFRDEILKADLDNAVHADPNSEFSAHARALNGFFAVLALCHTVLTSVDPETHAIEYKAQSPDEAALVQAAADVGFVFRGREKERLRLQTPFSEDIEEYELLNILEFTSARKRMSVVLRRIDTDDSRLFLMTKGADNVIFERLKEGGQELKDVTEEHLGSFAGEGLRTLTLAYKVIPEDEYEAWSERYHEATTSLDDREAKVEAISDDLERDLRLLGATAIEDRLQDGVPETIADLKRAGIKVWVATGDKLETAIAIGHSTNLIGPESNIIIIRDGSDRGRSVYDQIAIAVEEFFPESDLLDSIQEVSHPTPTSQQHGDRSYPLRRVNTGVSSIVGSDNGERPGGFVLVIDGTALGYALENDQNKDLLLRLATLCEGVICCRVSPLQKALVVRMVKEGLGVMTLAIGDGANDVSMIQAADVGVGISGEEGLQAVNSSDYAIGQFRFLKKLLLVHGHWSYARNGNMIVNFFYKNIVCNGVLWWFQIYDAWSSNYVFNYTYLLFWNSFWTIAPVIGLGIFDRLVDYHVLMAFPELYRYGREGKWFGTKLFSIYVIDGIYQSAIIFFITLYAYMSPTSRTDGYDGYIYEFSTTMVLSAVFVANMFVGLNTSVWTGWIFFAVAIGTILVWGFTAIYSVISPGWFSTGVYGNDHYLFESAYFWLCLPITFCLALAPRYIAKAWKFGFVPDDINIMQYVCKMEPDRNLEKEARFYQAGGASGLAAMKRATGSHSRQGSLMREVRTSMDGRASRASSVDSAYRSRASLDARGASRTDMSTGMRSFHRGFSFSQEEGGVEMRRMQSNLSGVRSSSRNLPRQPEGSHRRLGHVFSIKKSLLGRKSSKRPGSS